MEPITTSIAAALVAGAVAASKDVATAAIKDAYNALKGIVTRKYSNTAPTIDQIEKKPSDEAKHAELAKTLHDGGAATDKTIEDLARKLLDAIADLKNNPKAEPLFDYEELEIARDMKMTNITGLGKIMRAGKVKVGQDFILDNIQSRSGNPNDKDR